MAVTLLQLQTRSRERADMESSDFVSDSELTGYINSSIAELHDLLVSAFGADYFLSEYSFSTVNGTADYALPATFYKLQGVDIRLSASEWCALEPFSFKNRNKGAAGALNLRYRLMGTNLKLAPVPTAVSTVKIWFTPKPTALALSTDSFDDINSFAEYVIVDAAIKMLIKEETDVSVLMAQKAELKRRIEVMAADRDTGNSESISDVSGAFDDLTGFWSRS